MTRVESRCQRRGAEFPKPDSSQRSFGEEPIVSRVSALFPLLLSAFACALSTASFTRRLRRSANVQVAQVPKRGLIFLAHPTCKVRIAQVLIARRLRHIL
jgi:hypothetical protein